jgi:hypothetical protein
MRPGRRDRGELCLCFQRFLPEQKLEKRLTLFVDCQNELKNRPDSPITVSAETASLYPQISAQTLSRWFRAFKRSGVAGLIPRYRGSDSIINRTPGMKDLIIAQIAHSPPHVRVTRLVESLKVRFPNNRRPEKSALTDFLACWKRE